MPNQTAILDYAMLFLLGLTAFNFGFYYNVIVVDFDEIKLYLVSEASYNVAA